MDWLDLKPYGLNLYLVQGPRSDNLVVAGEHLPEFRQEIDAAGFKVIERRPDLGMHPVGIDPDGGFLPGEAALLDKLRKAFPRARKTSFDGEAHGRLHDATAEQVDFRRMVASGRPRTFADLLLKETLDELNSSEEICVERRDGRYHFSTAGNLSKPALLLVADDLGAGLRAVVAVMSGNKGRLPAYREFEEAMSAASPPVPGQVLATFSGEGHAIRVAVAEDGYELDAVTAFGEHELSRGIDLDAMLRSVSDLVSRERPDPVRFKPSEGTAYAP